MNLEEALAKIQELTNENDTYKQQIENFKTVEQNLTNQIKEKEEDIKSLKISNYDYFCKLTQQNKIVDDIDSTEDDKKESFESLDELLKEEFK